MSKILKRANEVFGPVKTIIKASEESAELAAAIAKLGCADGPCTDEWAGVVDEMADVEITTERLSMLYPTGRDDFEEAVFKRKAFKLKRLEGVLDEYTA
ncbi:hypothetical protein [Desulfovibrio gilichinskyi]|uniref:Uncharacterized protein n=1 Tax=Desulfovibrio gilichinskyi TaxID=1519643 RepID=A0A1X7C3I4_9BACT|nr:hypothetical protein [Desulfovibrio gilichinskyi]SME89326.1 hypothetical protein SAMN06295933_0275 [Desulfovibrio gilichinskyi]